MAKYSKNELDKIIKGIIKEMDAARTVEDIAKRNGVEIDYVNDVLQIYSTHKGIDTQGIIDRLPEDML